MSKTFTSTNDTDAPIHSLTVGDSDGEVLVRVNFGKVHKGVLIATADAPAVALAILEAAGFKVQPFNSANGAEIAVGNLASYVKEQERKAKEAADREALEKDAFELANAWRAAHDCEPFPTWDSVTNPGGFLALARKACTMYGAKP